MKVRKIQCITLFLEYQVEKILSALILVYKFVFAHLSTARVTVQAFSLFHPYNTRSSNHWNAYAISFTGRDLDSKVYRLQRQPERTVGLFFFSISWVHSDIGG